MKNRLDLEREIARRFPKAFEEGWDIDLADKLIADGAPAFAGVTDGKESTKAEATAAMAWDSYLALKLDGATEAALSSEVHEFKANALMLRKSLAVSGLERG